MDASLQGIGEHTQICPKCKKLHLTDNNYCEHCLYEFNHDVKLGQSRGFC